MFFEKKYKDKIIILEEKNKQLQDKLNLANARIGGLTAANNRYRKDNEELSKINLLLQTEVNVAKPLKEQNEKLNKKITEVQNEKVKINSDLTSKANELSEIKNKFNLVFEENNSNKRKIIKLQGIVDNLNKLINIKMRDKVTMQELKNYCEGGKSN